MMSLDLLDVQVGAVADPASGEKVEKAVFVVFFAGERAKTKILKVRAHLWSALCSPVYALHPPLAPADCPPYPIRRLCVARVALFMVPCPQAAHAHASVHAAYRRHLHL